MKYTKKILMILITCFCTFLNAEKKQPNPYAQGTERIVLTDIEKASLKAYAENSKTLLEEALSEANGKSLEEANSIYQAAIIRVVAESFEKKYHSELLLRFTLNQALELTIGTPDPESFLQLNRGVLKNIANGDLVTAIYENSIKLALNYYQSDMDAIESGDFVKLPFIDMAMERLLLAQKWMGGISSPQLRLKFLITALEHWYLTVTQRENLDINKVAHLIIGVDQALEDVKKYRNIGKKIRSLRGKILWVLKQDNRIKRDNQIEQNNQNEKKLRERLLNSSSKNPEIPCETLAGKRPRFTANCISIIKNNIFDQNAVDACGKMADHGWGNSTVKCMKVIKSKTFDKKAVDVCKKLISKEGSQNQALNCMEIIKDSTIKDSTFDQNAINACGKMANHGWGNSTVGCMKIIKNKTFDKKAVDVCKKLISKEGSQSGVLNCMEIIKDSTFDQNAINACGKMADHNWGNSTVGCMKIIKNKIFDERVIGVLDVCKKLISKEGSQSGALNCMNEL